MGVYTIPGTGKIHVFPRKIFIHRVICEIVNPAEGECRSCFIFFSRMIEDHIQDNLDPGFVELFHHIPEFIDWPKEASVGAVVPMRCKKCNRLIAPVVFSPRRCGMIVKFKYRHKLNALYTKLFQIRYFFYQTCIRSLLFRRNTGIGVFGKAPDVHFVNDGGVQGSIEWLISFPVKVPGVYHNRFKTAVCIVFAEFFGCFAVIGIIHDPAGVRIYKHLCRIEIQSSVWLVCTVYPVSVHLSGLKSRNKYVPVIGRLVFIGIQCDRFIAGYFIAIVE